jgi:SP family sugar:H+ symporter-like MFS transporter
MSWLRTGTPAPVVQEELRLIKAAIDEQHELHYAATFADCFKGSNRRRTFIAIGVQAFQQLQGPSVRPKFLSYLI